MTVRRINQVEQVDRIDPEILVEASVEVDGRRLDLEVVSQQLLYFLKHLAFSHRWCQVSAHMGQEGSGPLQEPDCAEEPEKGPYGEDDVTKRLSVENLITQRRPHNLGHV